MRIAWAPALVCALSWSGPSISTISAAPGCQVETRRLVTMPGRVDSLLAAPATGAVMALVGQPGSRVRFLPYDSLVVFRSGQPAASTRTIRLAPYVAAPGLAATADGRRLYVLADSTLLILDGLTGTVTARRDLGLQAIGWPAAITTDSAGIVFLVGQPTGVLEAQAYAFSPDRRGVPRQLWRAPLGLTHAGTWIGVTGDGELAVYMPDASDTKGVVARLNLRDGAEEGSYAVEMPPVAADAARNRLYLAGIGTIHALTLHSGAPVANVAGDTPFAAGGTVGLVAFVRGKTIVLADAVTLRTVRQVPFPGGSPPTALTWMDKSLLVGNEHGVSQISLNGCLR